MSYMQPVLSPADLRSDPHAKCAAEDSRGCHSAIQDSQLFASSSLITD